MLRTPLNVVVGLLQEVASQLKFIQGQKKKRRKKRPKNEDCDCDGFGPDPSVPGNLAKTLETVILAVKYIIKLVNIILVLPGGGLCKNNNDDIGTDVGETLGAYLPLTAIG